MRILILFIAGSMIVLGVSMIVRRCETDQRLSATNQPVNSQDIENGDPINIKDLKPDSIEMAIARGKANFEFYCQSCHRRCGRLIGPGVKGARQKWNNDAKLYDFTMHPEKYIGKDPYIIELQKESDGAIMAVVTLTIEEVKDIYLYLDTAPCTEVVP